MLYSRVHRDQSNAGGQMNLFAVQTAAIQLYRRALASENGRVLVHDAARNAEETVLGSLAEQCQLQAGEFTLPTERHRY